MEKISYKPSGVCSKLISVDLADGMIVRVEFAGGCPGNALGLARLVAGRTPEEVIKMLKGIRCGRKNTSCPDQLAKALVDFLTDER